MSTGFGASSSPDSDPQREERQPAPRGLVAATPHALGTGYAPDDVVQFASSFQALAKLEAALKDPLREGGVKNVRELSAMLNPKGVHFAGMLQFLTTSWREAPPCSFLADQFSAHLRLRCGRLFTTPQIVRVFTLELVGLEAKKELIRLSLAAVRQIRGHVREWIGDAYSQFTIGPGQRALLAPDLFVAGLVAKVGVAPTGVLEDSFLSVCTIGSQPDSVPCSPASILSINRRDGRLLNWFLRPRPTLPKWRTLKFLMNQRGQSNAKPIASLRTVKVNGEPTVEIANNSQSPFQLSHVQNCEGQRHTPNLSSQV